MAASPMRSPGHEAWLERRRARIHRIKRFLRYIPRRANMHRYPVLKWFAVAARKRSYLWSFRAREVVPAIYLGWMASMVPVPIHMALVLLLSFVIRCNLMVGWALVWVTNPITIPFFLYVNYHIGAWVLKFLGMHMEVESFRELAHSENLFNGQGRNMAGVMKKMLDTFYAWTVGGLVTGFVGGFITATLYRLFARKLVAESRPPPPTTAKS